MSRNASKFAVGAMLAIAILLVLSLGPGRSAEASEIRPLLGLSYSVGGETPNRGFAGGDVGIPAGNAFSIDAGATLPLSMTAPSRFESQLSVGYAFESDGNGKEDRARWTRVPIRLMSFYRRLDHDFRVGFGLVYQIANGVTGEGKRAGTHVDFKNAVGGALEATYFLPAKSAGELGRIGFGTTLTSLRYERTSGTGGSIDASSIGFHMIVMWGDATGAEGVTATDDRAGERLAPKPLHFDTTDEQRDAQLARRAALTGSFAGEIATEPGVMRKWLMKRRPDGTFTVHFVEIKDGKKIFDQSEAGDWGVSGTTYFSLTRELSQGRAFTRAPVESAQLDDAYEIIDLNPSRFRYRHVLNGTEYEVHRVAEDYRL